MLLFHVIHKMVEQAKIEQKMLSIYTTLYTLLSYTAQTN